MPHQPGAAPRPNSSSIPPALPPSVESSYRLKCISLKRRINDVDEANDAYRLRKVRLNRGIMKLRLERAFLLEQLAKRTSENVEDSEGSPSPPPTARRPCSPHPKEKPLRIKRGHRRPTDLPLTPGNITLDTPVATQVAASSPVDDRAASPSGPTRKHPSHKPTSTESTITSAMTTTGHDADHSTREAQLKKPGSAFALFCNATRPLLIIKEGREDVNKDQVLARTWHEMPAAEKAEWFEIYDERRAEWDGHAARTRKARDAPMEDVSRGEDEAEREADRHLNGDALDDEGDHHPDRDDL